MRSGESWYKARVRGESRKVDLRSEVNEPVPNELGTFYKHKINNLLRVNRQRILSRYPSSRAISIHGEVYLTARIRQQGPVSTESWSEVIA